MKEPYPYFGDYSMFRNYQPPNYPIQAPFLPYMQEVQQTHLPFQNPYGQYQSFGVPPQFPMGSIPYNPYQQGYVDEASQQTHIFQNPLQSIDEYSINNKKPSIHNQYPNPYPQGNHSIKPQGGMSSLMNSFKSQDGSIDFNKMVNTAGQMMNAVNQMSTMVKGLGGLFKV
ncbi:YppG family protein [Heyndrickxia sp. NPDC080065]|uniref:YppG family protein n=1 Tax=Heyndrickxia sp. NPDC080065 TaxID=3390568 RepID=UPI003D058604